MASNPVVVGVDYGGGLVVEYCPDGGMFEL